MTKPSSILLTKANPVEHMSERDLAVVRRFLFDGYRGLDEKHDRRWRRLWSRFVRAEVGEVFQLQTVVDRSGPFHRMHMAMEQSLFDRQDQWATLDHMREWLKTGAGWGEFKLNHRGAMKFTPRSTAYESCSDDEMRELHTAMLAFLRAPSSQRKLWPHLAPAARSEMLEAIIDPPQREQGA
jgi:hypothetical protein